MYLTDPLCAASGGSQAVVTRGGEETLGMVTSAVVYLLKVRLTLTDQIGKWGYVPQITEYLSKAIDIGTNPRSRVWLDPH